MARSMTTLEIRRTERLTPHMIRVVAGGPGIVNFADTAYTDRYVKIIFPRPGVTYPEPFDMEAIRAELPRESWPSTRTYTVRAFDVGAGELTIDFVHHGDEGIAGPWAAGARPGDVLRLLGPGGAYAPAPDADWHLMIGDEAALPAIGAACEQVGSGVPVLALLEVGDPGEQQKLQSPGNVDVRWLYRSADARDQLLDAVRAAEFPPGRVDVFLHGEAGFVRDIRRHLLAEREIPREHVSVSGYWRKGRDEDGWQADKAAERAAEQATAG